MPNPRAQRPLTLDRAVEDIKSFQVPARALADMMAGALRGSTAATLGLPGDIENLGRGALAAARAPSGQRLDAFASGMEQPTVLPTTERMMAILPKATPVATPYEELGQFAPLPGSAAAAKALSYGAGRAAGAGTRAVGQAISDAMIHQAGPLASGPLSALAPRAAMTNVVKPKGGNWLSGSVEKVVKPLKPRSRELREQLEDTLRLGERFGDQEIVRSTKEELAKIDAVENWVDRNLTNYIKKEMATPEDPVRKLAEQGIVHMPTENVGLGRSQADMVRQKYGTQQLGQSEAAKAWEDAADVAMHKIPVSAIDKKPFIGKSNWEPWMEKADPNTELFYATDNMHPYYLGFDHIVDVLKQDVASGRIRPEQLNKVSMEQAVRRTYEYDQEMAKKMAEAQIKATEGMPVHKEYPEGYKWIELAPQPEDVLRKKHEEYVRKDFPDIEKYDPWGFEQYVKDSMNSSRVIDQQKLADALKYEGETMGHCVGNYCPDVAAGKSRIYSLRDAKGEPHVTVEVKPSNVADAISNLPAEERHALAQSVKDQHFGGVMPGVRDEDKYWEMVDQAYIDKYGTPAPTIKQIKGKQNRAPKEEYLPYVQDFVKGGKWSDVGDLHNTGLRRTSDAFNEAEQAFLKSKGVELNPYIEPEETARYQEMFKRSSGVLPEEDMAAGGAPKPPSDEIREKLRQLRDSFVPLANEFERQKKIQDNLEKMNKKISFSDNPDSMMMDVEEAQMAGGGNVAKLARLLRAPAKTKEEIRAVAERVAPQVTGEYVRKGPTKAETIAGKTQKQFEREKDLPVDIRPTGEARTPQKIDIESLKGSTFMGIPGDYTVTGKTLHGVGDVRLDMPSPQHGGPLYGLYHDDAHFWASEKDRAATAQNLARTISQQYESPVIGNYIMMGPEGMNYAQHFADANLQAIDLSKMSKRDIEKLNKAIREGSAESGRRESFPGIEDKGSAYLWFSQDPALRKHFNQIMQKESIAKLAGLPSGYDVRFAVTEPELRDLERGVTGFSMGQMRPDIPAEGLRFSEHPTYSHDIPGHFLGQSKYPIPYELSFPDTVKAIRENPRQAPHEFGTLQYIGARQPIDQQLIDEIKQYEEMMKSLTGKKKGGQVKKAAGGEITAEDLDIEERPL